MHIDLLTQIIQSERVCIENQSRKYNYYNLVDFPHIGVRVDDKAEHRMTDREREVIDFLMNCEAADKSLNPLSFYSLLVPFHVRKTEAGHTECFVLHADHSVYDKANEEQRNITDNDVFSKLIGSFLLATTRAVAFLHEHEISHRDVHHGNARFIYDNVYLTDFSESVYHPNRLMHYSLEGSKRIDREHLKSHTQIFINEYFQRAEPKRYAVCYAVSKVGEDFIKNNLPVSTYYQNVMACLPYAFKQADLTQYSPATSQAS